MTTWTGRQKESFTIKRDDKIVGDLIIAPDVLVNVEWGEDPEEESDAE